MKPLISVIIPSHNSEKTIATAIKSILDQTYENLEIIVVDDNSTDDTKKVVETIAEISPKVRYFKLPFDDPNRRGKNGRNINAGYMARNYGFEQVRGTWITFQDADDASFRNRIEVEYALALKYNAWHVCIEWQQFDDTYLGKKLDVDAIFRDHQDIMINSAYITHLARRTKGIAMYLPQALRSRISFFDIKTKRVINKLFFGSLDSYPGSGNCVLFKREVIEKVKFRALPDRVWPSFTGRGADRDFNFQVAETFGKSISFKLPLYLWRVNRQNPPFVGYDKYIVN
jgi:glycosyltransferase involved in cell wall biosynthesis